MRTPIALFIALIGCVESRDDSPMSGTAGEAEPPDELFDCGCPHGYDDAEGACDEAALRAAFSDCDDELGIPSPCPTVRAGCEGADPDVAALDCVLEQLAAGNAILYTIERESCDGGAPYVVMMRAEERAPDERFYGLECYGRQGSQIPFEAMFSLPERFADCLEMSDAALRFACLFDGVGFAEPERNHCP